MALLDETTALAQAGVTLHAEQWREEFARLPAVAGAAEIHFGSAG